ncbi:TPR repeat region-containing protein [Phytomonospora endophytica]|uniref:TPR repeat domain-containing protein n=1 Tax=Phytomonospora endophytica TaxID=714109 RepID=A0A841FP30_9ACTN|nr:hypothetical protein [Phytomonospora endophytica]MBB6034987.1 hypothetical protein [Phytomonospora endophytica]GIG71428.1 hypothetical protein Pen01_77230 [Phytomonospora endophytica]
MAWDASPWETKANDAVVRANANNLNGLAGQITGRGSNLRGTIEKGAVEFSSIVSDPIRQRNADNMASWQEGTQAAIFGGTVLNGWAGEIKTFRLALEALEARYRTELNKIFEIGTGGPGEGAASTSRLQRQESLEGELTREATRLRGVFDDETEKRGGQMANGPTPEVLKELVGSGEMGWAAFNLWGVKAPVPLDAKDGEDLAEMLKNKIKNGEKLTDADRELLLQLQALTGHAAWLQKNGGDLTKNELAFLKAFYDGIGGKRVYGGGGMGGNHDMINNGALFQIDEWLKDGKLSAGDAALVRGAVGSGILALSDEGIGGGLDMLPETVQRLVNTEINDDQIDGNNVASEWREGFGKLAPLLGAAAPGLVGGLAFSSRTTVRMAEFAHWLGGAEDKPPFGLKGGVEHLAGMEQILDASTRNHEANQTVLTGGVRNSEYGADTPEFVLRELFGQPWKDNGKSAAGLIDWIPGAATSDEPYERYLAGTSTASLIDVMTNTEKTHWDQPAFEFFTGAGGPLDGDINSPMGKLNPYVSREMGEIATTYMQSFGGIDGSDSPKTQWGYMITDANGKEVWVNDGLQISENDRVRFFQLVAGDPVAGAKLGDDVMAVIYDNSKTMAEHPELAGRLSAVNGQLFGNLANGLRNNALDYVAGVESGQAGDTAKAIRGDTILSTWAGAGVSVGFTGLGTGIDIYDNLHPGGRLGSDVHGPLIKSLPTGIAQAIIGAVIPLNIDPTTPYDASDIDMKPVAGNIDQPRFQAYQMHGMLANQLESGKIDYNDLPKNLQGDNGGLRGMHAETEDMKRMTSDLAAALRKSGVDPADTKFDSYIYASDGDRHDFNKDYDEYKKWRNNPEHFEGSGGKAPDPTD